MATHSRTYPRWYTHLFSLFCFVSVWFSLLSSARLRVVPPLCRWWCVPSCLVVYIYHIIGRGCCCVFILLINLTYAKTHTSIKYFIVHIYTFICTQFTSKT